MTQDKQKNELVERYKRLQMECEQYGGLVPEAYHPCHYSLKKSYAIPSIAVGLAMLLDDVMLALKSPDKLRDADIAASITLPKVLEANRQFAEHKKILLADSKKMRELLIIAMADYRQDATNLRHNGCGGISEFYDAKANVIEQALSQLDSAMEVE